MRAQQGERYSQAGAGRSVAPEACSTPRGGFPDGQRRRTAETIHRAHRLPCCAANRSASSPPRPVLGDGGVQMFGMQRLAAIGRKRATYTHTSPPTGPAAQKPRDQLGARGYAACRSRRTRSATRSNALILRGALGRGGSPLPRRWPLLRGAPPPAGLRQWRACGSRGSRPRPVRPAPPPLFRRRRLVLDVLHRESDLFGHQRYGQVNSRGQGCSTLSPVLQRLVYFGNSWANSIGGGGCRIPARPRSLDNESMPGNQIANRLPCGHSIHFSPCAGEVPTHAGRRASYKLPYILLFSILAVVTGGALR